MAYIQLPNGRDLQIPDGMDYDTAEDLAKHQFPEAFGIEQKHGAVGAFKNAFGSYVANTGAGLSEIPGLSGLRSLTESYGQPDTTPGAWKLTTSEDVAL